MVSSYYHLLVGHSEQFFPWKSIWKQKIPSRVTFFVWTFAFGKCLIIDNLRNRKVCILDWCYMCKCNCEPVDHLFLHCPVALELWIWCLVYLEFIGLCLCLSLGYLLASKVDLVTIVMEIYEWLFLIVCCGAFGRREIVGALKTSSASCLTSSSYFSELYWTGSLCGGTILFLLFWIYLIFLCSFLICSPCIPPVYLGVSLFFFNQWNFITYQKKKKKNNHYHQPTLLLTNRNHPQSIK